MRTLEEKIGKQTYDVITKEHSEDFLKSYILVNKLFQNKASKDGNPYLIDLYTLCNLLETEKEKVVALLQNVLEDTELTKEDLSKLGFSSDIIDAVDLLTKREDMTYKEYIDRVRNSKNLTVLRVKYQSMVNGMEEKKIQDVNLHQAYKSYTKVERTLKRIEKKEKKND